MKETFSSSSSSSSQVSMTTRSMITSSKGLNSVRQMPFQATVAGEVCLLIKLCSCCRTSTYVVTQQLQSRTDLCAHLNGKASQILRDFLFKGLEFET
mmetsp:Transcript_28023/g.75690  ORF Transcript_28023/g.75690 Transcript_28023/m.75690 type:complete len:97 (+) Transcript_28023:568-858(+)